jgi:hypothetical protein
VIKLVLDAVTYRGYSRVMVGLQNAWNRGRGTSNKRGHQATVAVKSETIEARRTPNEQTMQTNRREANCKGTVEYPATVWRWLMSAQDLPISPPADQLREPTATVCARFAGFDRNGSVREKQGVARLTGQRIGETGHRVRFYTKEWQAAMASDA